MIIWQADHLNWLMTSRTRRCILKNVRGTYPEGLEDPTSPDRLLDWNLIIIDAADFDQADPHEHRTLKGKKALWHNKTWEIMSIIAYGAHFDPRYRLELVSVSYINSLRAHS